MIPFVQKRIHIVDKLVISRFIKVCLIVIFSISNTGCGERYRNEGDKLKEEINKELITQKLCASISECNLIFRTFSGHGNQVNFSVYAPDKQALAVVFKFLLEKGLIITRGVPISIKVYPKTNEEYGNNLFYSSAITLEIKQ